MSAVPQKPLNALAANLRAIDQYWFGYGSPTSLGVFRICIGVLSLINWLMIAVDWTAWFGESGYVPSWLGALWISDNPPLAGNFAVPRLNLLYGVTDPAITIPFYIATIVFAALTALGLWTRYAAFFLAICTVTLHHRNLAILHGGDTVLRLCTIYLAVSPCGRACSLDRLIGLWRGTESHLPVRIPLWAPRLVTFNVALLYLTTIWIKFAFGGRWKDLSATYYPARLAEFYRFPVPDFLISLPMSRVTTFGTILTEFALATLVFIRPLRKYVLLGGVLMHGYIEYSMNIPLFSYLMISMYVCFFDGEEVSAWAQRTGMRFRRFHVAVRLPAGTRLRPNSAAFFDALDPFKMVAFLPGDTESWSAARPDGRPLRPARAIVTRSPGAWVFGWLPRLMQRLLNSATEPDPATGPRR